MTDVILVGDIIDLRHLGGAVATIEGRLGAIERSIESLVVVLETIVNLETKMSAEFEAAIADLASKVEQTTTVVGSAVTLIQDLAAMIAEQANDPAQVQALAAALGQTADQLAAAVAANTPSEPAPAEPPAEPAPGE